VLISRVPERGVTLIELMIGLAIVALVLFVAVPSFGIFLQNSQIRNAAGSALNGLQLARNEAIRRNTPVRFQFVSDLTASCTLSTTSLAWVVSQADPTGACDTPASDTVAPQIVQSRSATEGTSNARVTVTGGSTVVFTGLGRAQAGGITQIDVTNTSGTCLYVDPTNGTMRCMRVVVSSGGQARMCDPQVTAANDPRKC
jgi:type IV fimbrial biogenesis protein FimT